ncbi:hypothetical protein M3O96_05085 [Aquiflexum sp. TKW24L]|uniref:hypothetical protein n=1 Tax=Aquiflexum sp. TKW24L TaxID=2942212 RepID=UPI0020BF775B|nr:hypothetical protein [Aquiflexum sp. TKW24L]MCL6258451.1 hypothetical protein [Aquiflexum sp. TKW24L]
METDYRKEKRKLEMPSMSLKFYLFSSTIYPDLKYYMEILTTKLKKPVVLKKMANP